MGRGDYQRPALYRRCGGSSGGWYAALSKIQRIGVAWVADMDRFDNEEEFKTFSWIFSAVARVGAGGQYPATLITTVRP